MDRRYLAALVFSLLILIAYPHYLRWIGLAPVPSSEEKPTPSATIGLEERKVPERPHKEVAPANVETFSFQNELYEILFTSRGGSVALLKQGGAALYQAHLEEPGIFGVTLMRETADLANEIFQTTPSSRRGLPPDFVYEKPGEYRITKRFFVGGERPSLILEVELENLSGRERNFPLELDYALDLGLEGHGAEEPYAKAVRFAGTELQAASLKAVKKNSPTSSEIVDWHGLIRKYYALLVKPDLKLIRQETRYENDRFVSRLELEPVAVGPGARKTVRVLLYAGPQRYDTLKEFGFGFEKIFSHGVLGAFKVTLLWGLNFFFRLTKNYGAAILLVTFVFKLLFTPLTHLSYNSMKKMQALQPKMKALQRQYQKDPSRLSKETMELYKRNRVNPMMGCLPMVLQIPIFIAFYQVLSEAVELKGAGFLGWIKDLSEPDRLFTWGTSLPFLGDAFNLLPILMIGSMLWQQKLTPQTAATPEQEKIMYLMPVIFGFVFYNLPSGLVLYWLINNVLTIFHQLFIKRIPVILHHEDRQDS